MSQNRFLSAPAIMLCCLLGMCTVVGLLFVIAEPAGGHGGRHPRFPDTMYEGATESDRLGGVRWLGLGFALLQALFFVTVLLLGVRRQSRVLGWWIVGGTLYLAAFVALVVAESVYAQGGARQIVLGLPLPTAIMVYLVGGIPVLFRLLYVWQFDRWVLDPDDLQRMNTLAAQQREADAQEAD